MLMTEAEEIASKLRVLLEGHPISSIDALALEGEPAQIHSGGIQVIMKGQEGLCSAISVVLSSMGTEEGIVSVPKGYQAWNFEVTESEVHAFRIVPVDFGEIVKIIFSEDFVTVGEGFAPADEEDLLAAVLDVVPKCYTVRYKAGSNTRVFIGGVDDLTDLSYRAGRVMIASSQSVLMITIFDFLSLGNQLPDSWAGRYWACIMVGI